MDVETVNTPSFQNLGCSSFKAQSNLRPVVDEREGDSNSYASCKDSTSKHVSSSYKTRRPSFLMKSFSNNPTLLSPFKKVKDKNFSSDSNDGDSSKESNEYKGLIRA